MAGITQEELRRAGLAYRLGYAPVRFERGARIEWCSPPPTIEGEELAFPLQLKHHVDEIQSISNDLSAALADTRLGRMATRFREAATSAFAELKTAWASPLHLSLTRNQDEEGFTLQHWFHPSPFRKGAWIIMHRAASDIIDALPESLAKCGALGVHVAAVSLITYYFRSRPFRLPSQVSDKPLGSVFHLLREVARHYPTLNSSSDRFANDYTLQTVDYLSPPTEDSAEEVLWWLSNSTVTDFSFP
jgi:hypothetical protein